MKLYTYLVSTKVGNFERIGVGHNGKIIDLNMACITFLNMKKEPRSYEYGSFIIPPNMIKYLEGGEK